MGTLRLNKSDAHERARRLLDKPDGIDRVTLDGREVSVTEAKEALREDAGLDELEVGELAQKLDKFEGWLEGAQVGIPGTSLQARIGKWSLSAMELAPDESITQVDKLIIHQADGEKLEVKAESIDLRSSAFLKRISAVVNGGSALPAMIGTIIGYSAGALSAVAAVGAHALGKHRVGNALIRMATKHFLLSTVTNVPVAGNAACVLAAARDERDAQQLTAASQAASVEQSVGLSVHGPAVLP